MHPESGKKFISRPKNFVESKLKTQVESEGAQTDIGVQTDERPQTDAKTQTDIVRTSYVHAYLHACIHMCIA